MEAEPAEETRQQLAAGYGWSCAPSSSKQDCRLGFLCGSGDPLIVSAGDADPYTVDVRAFAALSEAICRAPRCGLG